MTDPWKARKTKSRFPTLPTGLWKSRKAEISTFPPPRRLVPPNNIKIKKGSRRCAAPHSPFYSLTLRGGRKPFSCSSFDWKMLLRAPHEIGDLINAVTPSVRLVERSLLRGNRAPDNKIN